MKKLIYVLTYLIMGVFTSIQAQESAPEFIWAISSGGTSVDDSFRIDTDQNGNIYSVGFFAGTGTFGDFTLTAEHPSGEMFVTKTDPSGNYSWAIHLEVLPYYFGADDDTHEYRGAVSVDESGYSYIMGSLKESAVIGDIVLNSYGGFDFFILKIDPAGNIVWVKQIGTENDEMGFSMKYFDDDNIYLTGVFDGTLNLGEFTLSGSGNRNIFVAKMDSEGNFIWAKEVNSTQHIVPRKLETDNNGNLYITGTYMGMVEFGDIPLTSLGYSDIYVAKLNSNGDFVMAKRAGGVSYDYAYDMAVDSQGKIYLTGRFTGHIIFDEIELNSTNQGRTGFVTKLDDQGNFVWAKKIEHTRNQNLRGQHLNLAVDSFDYVYLNENFIGSVMIDDYTLTSQDSRIIYVLKFNEDGLIEWVKSSGQNGSTSNHILSIDKNDNIILSGEFGGTPQHDDFILENQGFSDIFIGRVSEHPTDGFNKVITVTEFSEYGRTYGDGNYDNGNLILVLAEPNPGYKFSHWEEAGQILSEEKEYLFTLIDDKDLLAVFSPEMAVNDLAEEKFKLFPNPAKDRLNIEYSKVIDELSVIGMNGKEVMKSIPDSNKTQLDISLLPSGIYILKIRSGKTVLIQKFIKN